MSWLVQYRATTGAQMTTQHDTRAEAFSVLADGLLATALLLWDAGHGDQGDRLLHHAVRLTAEAEMGDDSSDGYLLNLSKGRKWVVCSV